MMTEDILKLINKFVYSRFLSEESCKMTFRDNMMSREDLMSELLVYVLEHMKKFDSTRGVLSTYVYMLCATKVGLLIRKNRHNIMSVSLDEIVKDNENIVYFDTISTDEDIRQSYVENETLKKAIDNTSEITKIYYLGCKQKDIAKKMNVTQSYVSREIQRDIEKVRKKMSIH